MCIRDSTQVAFNKVHGLTQSASNGTITGIYLSNPSGSNADNSVYCYNNMVYDLKATGTGSKEVGIGTYYPGGINIFNNTVFLNFNNAQSGNIGRGIWTQQPCNAGLYLSLIHIL